MTPRFRTLLTRATLVAVGALALLAACYEDDTGPTQPFTAGPTRVYLTDDPFPFDSVRSVEIYVESIAASAQADTTGVTAQQWLTVATPRRRVDLLDYQNGHTALLGEGALPAGTYKAVRMVINTDSSRIVGVSGNEEQVNWQSSAGRPTLYALVEGAAATGPEEGAEIVIDFDVGRSFRQEFPGGPFTFLPWIRAVNRAATGSVKGVVQGALLDGTLVPIPNATISVYRGGGGDEESWSLAATARADAVGEYTAAFLMPGTYVVQAEAPGPRQLAGVEGGRFFHAEMRTGISVARGEATAESFSLAEVERASFGIEGARGRVVAPGDTIELSVYVSDADGLLVTNPAVTWTSSNESVATVTGSGRSARVAGIAVGAARVIAQSGERTDSVTITVTTDTAGTGGPPPGDPVAAVTISPAEFTVTVGDSIAFVATPRAADGHPLTDRPVAWAVSDSTVAYFMSAPNGPPYAVLRARARGTVRVLATSEGKSAIAALTVQ